MAVLAGCGGKDLLDDMQTKAYWRIRGVDDDIQRLFAVFEA